MNEEKVLVLIDADGLIYQSSKEDFLESVAILDEKIQNILEKTNADFYSVFISLGGYFRHRVDPTYKVRRRSYPSKLLWTKSLKNYLIEKYNAVAGKDVEADDLVAYFFNMPLYEGVPNFDVVANGHTISIDTADIINPTKLKIVLASPDKDLLFSIPGKHFNYSYTLQDKEDLESLIKGWWVDTSEAMADEFLRSQMVIGDAADGVSGLSGKGSAFWKKLSKDVIPSWGEILQLYIDHHGNVATGIYEYQKNYRLLKLLDCPSDFLREVGYMPEFVYNTVEKSKVEF